MNISQLRKSFLYAWRGARTVLREEQNFRLQIGAAMFVFLLGWFFHLRPIESAILALVTGSVLVLELLNSVLERVVDLVKPRVHPYIAEIKNIAAAAVLVAAFTAIAVAFFIFIPHLLERF